jgi:hypothetical protein
MRCVEQTISGQCPNPAVKGELRCPAHSTVRIAKKSVKKAPMKKAAKKAAKKK